MAAYHWKRAGPGLYYIRDHPGFGPSCGSMRRLPLDRSIYRCFFDHGEACFTIDATGQPKTAARILEALILTVLPDATFEGP